MRLNSNQKRIGIFAFYDKDGIVDDYIPYLIDAVRQYCGYMLCVVNGNLNEEGRAKLAKASDEILVRANEGLDITGYKEGYFHLKEKVEKADEVLFFNQTIYGPVCSLEHMFSDMDARDLDFWGLSMHKGLKADLKNTIWNKVEYGYLPPHIQSFFFAVRGRMLHGKDFQDYWEKLPTIHNYIEAVSYHEVRFTKYFKDLGYRGEPFIDCTEWNHYIDYGLMGIPSILVREKHCPFVKRKSFFEPRRAVLSIPQGGASEELYRTIDADEEYETRYILENLTRTVPCIEYTTALSPSFCPRPGSKAKGQVALVMWINDAQLINGAVAVASTLPEGGKLFCLLTEDVIKQQVHAALPTAQIFEKVQDGFSFLFANLWPLLKGFEYLCYLPLCPPIVTDDLRNLSLVCTLQEALGNIEADLTMIREMSGVGAIVPVPDSIDNMMTSLPIGEMERAMKFIEGSSLARLPKGKRLMRLSGNAFFAVTSAVAALAELPWDKACELKQQDQEVLLPLALQARQKLLGYSLPWNDAVRELWNTREQITRFGAIFEGKRRKNADSLAFYMQGIKDFFDERRYQMTLDQAFHAKLSFKQKVWIILQLFISPKAFIALRKFAHGGQLPQQEVPEDEVYSD